ncbi:MAG: T9SS type A sorting domain-containing protein, partial [Balneolaceae bacterium]
YPNPFNPSTRIEFEVPQIAHVRLEVFNIVGQKVAELLNETKAIGSYSIDFNARTLPSGVYLYRLEAGSQTIIRKMTLLK